MVYEQGKNSELDLGTEGKQVDHWNDEVYNYDRTSFAYNTHFPKLLVLYNTDLGLGLQTGVQFTRQKFGKKEYASKHAINLSVSTENINVLTFD